MSNLVRLSNLLLDSVPPQLEARGFNLAISKVSLSGAPVTHTSTLTLHTPPHVFANIRAKYEDVRMRALKKNSQELRKLPYTSYLESQV